jgi:O-antigen/teichoic acid export membrane protein
MGQSSLQLKTFRQGGWMLVATVVTGIFNYLSNVFVGRTLGPADYSTFTALLSLSVILSVVASVVQTSVANYVAHLRGRGSAAEVSTLFSYLLRRLLPWGMGSALAVLLASRPLAAFLRIPSSRPVIAFSPFLVLASGLPVVNGMLRGLQRFGALGWIQIGGAASRLISAVVLVSLGLGAAGAVLSLPLSLLGASVLGLILLTDLLRQQPRGSLPELSKLVEYSCHAVLTTVCLALLTNGDIVFVKSRFSPIAAGHYSAIATLGKTTFWLSSAIVMLLLPKAAEVHARGQSAIGLVRKSLLATVTLCGSVTLAFLFFPSLIVRAFFGEQYLAQASLLGLYGLAMTLFSLVNVWLFYYLAVEDRLYTYVFLTVVVLSLLSLLVAGSSLSRVVIILIGAGSILCLGGEFCLFVQSSRSAQSNPSHGHDKQMAVHIERSGHEDKR